MLSMADFRFSSKRPTPPKRGLFGRFQNAIEGKPASDRWLLRGLFFAGLAGLLVTGALISKSYSSPVPVSGGTLEEGILGVPRFINPVLATTRADLDLVALTYSGLMRISPDGTLVPDLAESVTVSDDGLTYNIIMKRDQRFHDDTPVTARDVAFTIGLVQNADLKSPLRANWTGVTVEEIDEYELNIILDQAYAPFIENFTLGILPRHIWSEVPVEQIPFSRYNTDPIGSGPFAMNDVARNESGIVSWYQLEQFPQNGYATKLAAVETYFFADETALQTALFAGEITSTAYLSNNLVAELPQDGSITTTTYPLPRLFGIFFNQNRSAALRDAAAREALSVAINRDEVINTALLGYGIPIASPIPVPHDVESISTSSDTAQSVADILLAGGWTRTDGGGWEKRIDGNVERLEITLRTANTAVFSATTDQIARMWRDQGIEVVVEPYDQTDLLQSVIRPRDYEALLFGLDMSRTVDLYPFWHSSEREDPGLNISQYANIGVDDLLETARTARTAEERAAAEAEAVATISSEYPAVFIFAPILPYVSTAPLTVIPMSNISKPHERFMNISEWHAETETLWSLFQ